MESHYKNDTSKVPFRSNGKFGIIKIVDRDDRSEKEVSDLEAKGIQVLKKRNLESYLLDDSVIKNYVKALANLRNSTSA